MTKPATAPKTVVRAPAAAGESAQAPAPQKPSTDVVVESSTEVAHNVKRRSPVKFKANVYGVGGVKVIPVEGVDPMVAVKLKMGDLPGGVTIMGVESGEGVINLRWSSSVAVNAMISGEVVL